MARRTEMHSRARKVGERVAELRRRAGWSQSEFAEVLGLEPSTLSRLETGKRGFSLELVFLAADKLGVPPTTLLVDADLKHARGITAHDHRLMQYWEALSPRQQELVVELTRELCGERQAGLVAAQD